MVARVIDEDEFRKRLGHAIRRARFFRDRMSQQALGDAIHRSKAAVSRWEGGRALPDAYDLARISAALRMPPDLLVNPPPVTRDPIAERLRSPEQ